MFFFFFVSFQNWTVIVDTAGHINYRNDKCPWWTVIVEKSTIVVQWTVIVAAATISVHGGQLSLMDSYRCYTALSVKVLIIAWRGIDLGSYYPTK